jgi:Na+-transporting NADH:ubiquinone oxidoreductase subunit NqrC
MANNAGRKQSPGKGGIIAVIVICVVAVLVLVAVAVVLLKKPKNQQEEAEESITKRNVVVTQNNVDEVVESMAMAEYIEPGYYSVSMTNEWHFATGDAVSEDAFVENKAENTNDVFFDVFLASDEETPILQSPVIPRGASLDKISLDTPLEAGTHDCIMIYHLVDEDQNTMSTLRIAFKIIVEK